MLPFSPKLTAALHVCLVLAQGCKEKSCLSSREIARSLRTHPVVVRRMLALLTQAGLVECSSGKNGGAKLARPPARITLLDLYRAIHADDCDTLAQTRRRRAAGLSRRPPACPIGRELARLLSPELTQAHAAVSGILGRATLARLLARLARD